MSRIALFDFDGTVTKKDSFIEFIKFCKGRLNFTFGFAILSPVISLYKVGVIQNWRAKEIVIKYFFKNWSCESFQKKCIDFAHQVIPNIVRPEAVNRLLKRKEENYRIVIITASVENWIKPWSDELNVELIGTRLEIIEGKITGRILGYNCYGEEKVRRLIEKIPLEDYNEIEVYGDSKGDNALMKIATKQYYRIF